MNRQRVYLRPYDARWPEAFARESAKWAAALGPAAGVIHHIGSTAIPGIHAKPIIDMLAEVPDLTSLDQAAPQLAGLGYEAMGEFGMAGRRYFRKNNEAGERTYQLHAFEAGSPQIARHLAFRDFLRAHPDHARNYETLKLRLAEAHPTDVSAYTDGKDAFIQEIDRKAAAWVPPVMYPVAIIPNFCH